VLLESFFREISGLLSSWDGSWKSPNDRIVAGRRSTALGRDPGRAKKRLNDVEIAYELAVSIDNRSDLELSISEIWTPRSKQKQMVR
jgi:hypothetical protein